jgi:hypothetical protein
LVEIFRSVCGLQKDTGKNVGDWISNKSDEVFLAILFGFVRINIFNYYLVLVWQTYLEHQLWQDNECCLQWCQILCAILWEIAWQILISFLKLYQFLKLQLNAQKVITNLKKSFPKKQKYADDFGIQYFLGDKQIKRKDRKYLWTFLLLGLDVSYQ